MGGASLFMCCARASSPVLPAGWCGAGGPRRQAGRYARLSSLHSDTTLFYTYILLTHVKNMCVRYRALPVEGCGVWDVQYN